MKKQEQPDWNIAAKHMAGEATEGEKESLLGWAKTEHENQDELQKINEAWTLAGHRHALKSIDENKAWEKLRLRMAGFDKQNSERSILRIWHSPYLSVAAAIILMVAVASAIYFIAGRQLTPASLISKINDAPTPLSAELSDGSLITLNQGTKLDYPEKFDGSERDVYLSGEAFFEVKHDPSRPFIVHTPDAIVRVVGTSFNVSAYNHSEVVKVVVESGKVELFSSHSDVVKVVLEKGNFGSISRKSGQPIKGNNNDINCLAWKTRKIRFDDTPLPEVIDVLNQVYHTHIELASDHLLNCRFTGTFSEESLDTILEVLKKAFGFKIDQTGKAIELSGKGC
jgi:transmembrane sensor